MRISIVNVRLVAIVFAGCLLVANAARADLFVAPWIGGNAGSTAGTDLVDLGASVGATAGGVVDIDVDLGYSPNYFATSGSSAVTTVMGDVTLGIPLGRSVRPYVTGGLGLIRSRFEIPALSSNVVRDELGTAFGGGLTVYAASRVGVRADLRYLRSLQQTTSGDPFGQFNPGRVRYWRASIGVVIR